MVIDLKDNVNKAVELFKARAENGEEPEGKRDRKGRWYPAKSEKRACCKLILKPTEEKPDILYKHCKSVEHVANLCEIPSTILRNLLVKKPE